MIVSLQDRKDDIDKEISILQDTIAQANIHYKANKKELQKKIEDRNKRIKYLHQSQNILQGKIAKIKFWLEGFGPRGIRSLLLDNILDDMNRVLNLNLNVVLRGVAASCDTEQITKKASKSLDTFTIRFFKGINEQKYKMFSGGERKLINIAIVLTLQELVRDRVGNPLKVLLFDEIFDSLSISGIEKVMTLLRTRYYDYQTLVISHNEKVSQFFNNTIEV
jgi:DNA repair exonuclease SbcCD ATPase subunit